MGSKKQSLEKVEPLKDGEHCYFNMLQDGGAVCYKCNGMYLLFEITQYGINEIYEFTYFENQLNEMIDKAYSWN